MRPIDADKIFEKVRKLFPPYRGDEQTELEFEVAAVISEILDEINDQPTVNEWIPFNENNLPEDYINAVVKISSKTKRICTYNVERKCWVDDIDGDIYEISEALEYIPLPETYKGGEDK